MALVNIADKEEEKEDAGTDGEACWTCSGLVDCTTLVLLFSPVPLPPVDAAEVEARRGDEAGDGCTDGCCSEGDFWRRPRTS